MLGIRDGSQDSQIDTRVRRNCVFCSFSFSQIVNMMILSGESGVGYVSCNLRERRSSSLTEFSGND